MNRVEIKEVQRERGEMFQPYVCDTAHKVVVVVVVVPTDNDHRHRQPPVHRLSDGHMHMRHP